MPERYQQTWLKWADAFPDHELTTWCDDDLARIRLPAVYGSARTFAEQADLARLSILNTFGGIYVDCDIEPLCDLQDLWTDEDRLIVFEERPGLIMNGFFACAPGALSFVQRFVERNLDRHPPEAAPNVRTGPFAFTAAIDYLRTLDPFGVRVYPPSFVDLTGHERFAVVRTRLQETPTWAARALPVSYTSRERLKHALFDLRILPLRGRRRLATIRRGRDGHLYGAADAR